MIPISLYQVEYYMHDFFKQILKWNEILQPELFLGLKIVFRIFKA